MIGIFHRATPTGQGIALTLLALVLFTLMDALAKHLMLSGYSPLQVVWARYMGQALLIVTLYAPQLARALRTRHPGLQAARSLLNLGAILMFFLSLPHIGLGAATALFAINPVLITLGAALFLGESVGPRRMAATGVALLGALVIIRPGSAVFVPAALLPLGSAFCLAGYALISRRIGNSDGFSTSLFYSALGGAALTSAALPWVWLPVASGDLLGFVGVGLLGTLGQLCFLRAYALAKAATIAPFGYSELILAAIWGLTFFGERPDAMTILGALVIVGAGLYVWQHEARIAAAAREQAKGT